MLDSLVLEILGDTLEAGAVVAKAYRLERVLGEGGMGVVWAAVEIATGRAVALKFLRAEREADPKNQQRLLREARAAMGVAHPNIARVEAVLETDAGVPFMVMELLQGESLRALLTRRGMLGAPECARIMVQVVDAVAAAHASGVVHRDLKPENIFLVNQTDVRVLDFGIAKRIASAEGEAQSASLTSAGMLLGTPLYMAPEQIFGDEDIDARADVWSLGIILYECLAARRPTDGDGFGPIIKRITTGELEPLERARPGLPGRIPRLVGRMLSRKKEERPELEEIREVLASVAVMGDELVPSAREPIGAAPALPASTTAGIESRRVLTGPVPATDASRARRGRTALAAGGIAIVLGAAWLGTSYGPASWRRKAAAPSGASASSSTDPWLLIGNASKAVERRDGAACLRELAQYDALSTRPGPVSTDPASTSAMMHATCMGLAGDCEGGKALYARAYAVAAAGSQPTPAVIESATDSFAATFCEGEKMIPRDALMRANSRLTVAAGGMRKASAAECREWHETAKRLVPVVKPRNAQDLTITVIPLGLEDSAATCLAYAGECAEALEVFRDGWMSKNPLPQGLDPQLHEQTMRAIHASRTGPTPCRGKP